MPQADRFLRACRREAIDATPIWLMRQAGRYMAEYRALREHYSILELIKNPEMAAQVTLQPIKAFNLDAAIIFADILPPLAGMGLNLEFVKGDGPVILNPLRTPADVEALAVRPAEETLDFTLQAIRLVKAELAGKVPLIGFAGARVIKDTTKQTLPAGFQTAEFLLKHGLVDQIVSRLELRERLFDILSALHLRKKSRSPAPASA